jgi:hypothetical protein
MTRIVLAGNILLQDIELLQNTVEKLLGVLIHDQDLPSSRRVHGSDRVEELWKQCQNSLTLPIVGIYLSERH